MVIKRTKSRREPFDRTKIEHGVQQAMRKRPVSQRQIQNMIDELEEAVQREGMESHEIPSQRIGEMVLDSLYDLDRVAYIRFASVYRNFEDVQEFMHEIEELSRR